MKLRFNASASNTSGGNVVVERLKMLLLFNCISGKSKHVKQSSSPLCVAFRLASVLLCVCVLGIGGGLLLCCGMCVFVSCITWLLLVFKCLPFLSSSTAGGLLPWLRCLYSAGVMS